MNRTLKEATIRRYQYQATAELNEHLQTFLLTYFPGELTLDSTVVRAHQYSAGQKNDAHTECLGRSRGGVGTKIHACVESLGNTVRLDGHPRLGPATARRRCPWHRARC